MILDKFATQVYIVALNEAKMQKHEYVTPEHLLYAFLQFEYGKNIIVKSGGNVDLIITDLQNHLMNNCPKIVEGNIQPIETAQLMQLLEESLNQAQSSGKKEVNINDIIYKIFELEESFAVYILESNGVNKFNFIKQVVDDVTTENIEEKNISNTETIDKYTEDLTAKAKNNEFTEVIGRDDIFEKIFEVLSRKNKNNPILIGDAGVGKSAIVEGVAQQIIAGTVPKNLKDSRLISLDIGKLLAGTRYRGDFEERIVKLLDEISEIKNAIVFIDDIHTIIGVGLIGNGGIDITNILKPYLQNGKVRFIGCTTYEDYKKKFEEDKTFNRRFQRIDVKEPTVTQTIEILNGLKDKYEKFHKVEYSKNVIEEICYLSTKFIKDSFQPDKSIDVLDTVGARAKINKKKKISVDNVKDVISSISKIPKESFNENEKVVYKNLEKNLNKIVIGQEKAIESVSNNVIMGKLGFTDETKPITSLLFLGTTGVGKTEIVKQLSNLLNVPLLRFDMSEYQEKHSVSKLIGSPAGYVGFETGGLLTNKVSREPYCIVLFDEIEKAHNDIFDLLLQVLDYGCLTDSKGKKVDFTKTIIILTSNAGAKKINKNIIGFENEKTSSDEMLKEAKKIFSPEFRNRLNEIIIFNELSEEMRLSIIKQQLDKLVSMFGGKKVKVKYTKSVIKYINKKVNTEEYGAREIIRYIDENIKKNIMKKIILVDDENLQYRIYTKKDDLLIESIE